MWGLGRSALRISNGQTISGLLNRGTRPVWELWRNRSHDENYIMTPEFPRLGPGNGVSGEPWEKENFHRGKRWQRTEGDGEYISGRSGFGNLFHGSLGSKDSLWFMKGRRSDTHYEWNTKQRQKWLVLERIILNEIWHPRYQPLMFATLRRDSRYDLIKERDCFPSHSSVQARSLFSMGWHSFLCSVWGLTRPNLRANRKFPIKKPDLTQKQNAQASDTWN